MFKKNNAWSGINVNKTKIIQHNQMDFKTIENSKKCTKLKSRKLKLLKYRNFFVGNKFMTVRFRHHNLLRYRF